MAREIATAQEQELQRKLKPQVTQRQRPFRFRDRVPFDVDTGITKTVAGITDRARSQNEKNKRTQEGLLKASVYNKLNTAKKMGLNSVLTADKANAAKAFNTESQKYTDVVSRTMDSIPDEAKEVVQPIVEAQLSDFQTTGTFHVAKETDIMAKNEHNALVAGKMEDVIRSVGAANFKSSAKLYNDSNYARYINALKGKGADFGGVGEALNNRIEYFGMGKEEAEQFREQYISGTHIGAIENLIGKKKVEEARFIFVKNQNDIDPTKHDDIERMLEAAEENQEADIGLRIANEANKFTDLKEQNEFVRKKVGNNQSLLNHVKHSMRQLKAEQKEINQQKKNRFGNTFMDKIALGVQNNTPSSELRSYLNTALVTAPSYITAQERSFYRNWGEKLISDKKIQTNPKYFQYLMDMARHDVRQFRNINPTDPKLKAQLAPSDYATVLGFWKKARAEENKPPRGELVEGIIDQIYAISDDPEIRGHMFQQYFIWERDGAFKDPNSIRNFMKMGYDLASKKPGWFQKLTGGLNIDWTWGPASTKAYNELVLKARSTNQFPTVSRYIKAGQEDKLRTVIQQMAKDMGRMPTLNEVNTVLNSYMRQEASRRGTIER